MIEPVFLIPIRYFIPLIITGAIGAYIFLKSRKNAGYLAVLDNLVDAEPEKVIRLSNIAKAGSKKALPKGKVTVENFPLALLTVKARRKIKRAKQFAPFVGFLIGILFSLISGASFQKLIITPFMGALIGYLYSGYVERKERHQFVRDIDFYLPLVMERLVMAAEAGHDILSALRAISLIEKKSDLGKDRREKDPVTRLLLQAYLLVEKGLSFEDALKTIALNVPNTGFQHAMVHLAVAYKDGGEVIAPLRELSDSSQLYFQESVEEEIAALPVKATMPLLITFAGLIVCFITAPMIQILDLIKDAMPQ